MIRDEAIEELRERRRELMKVNYENSIERLFEDAGQWQKKHPERVVHPQRIKVLKKAS